MIRKQVKVYNTDARGTECSNEKTEMYIFNILVYTCERIDYR